MNNKEFYRNTFDQIHVSNETRDKLKSLNNNKKYSKRNYYVRYAVIATVLSVIIGSNVICYAATGQNFYSFVVNSSIIQSFFNEGGDSLVAEHINSNTSYVQNQSVAYDKYLFNFYRYYAEENTGIILAEFYVTDPFGSQLSEEESKNLYTEVEDWNIWMNVTGINGTIDTEVFRDNDGNTVLAFNCMVALLGSDDTKVNTDNISNVTELVLNYVDKNGKCTDVGKFMVPSDLAQMDSATFDVSDNPKIEYAVISGIGMQIVFNINVAKEELQKELEASGMLNDPNYDPEAHGYNLYKDLSIFMKDGTEYPICENWRGYVEDDALLRHGSGHPYEYSTRLDVQIFSFSKLLDVSQVDSIQIDGVLYKIFND